MTNKKLSEYSITDLEIEVSSRKKLFYVMCFLLLVIVGSGIINTIQRGFSVFTILPIVFIAIFLNLHKNYKDAKTELESRQSVK